MPALLDLQVATANEHMPTAQDFQLWLDSILEQQKIPSAEVTIRLVESEESQQLNQQYRQKNKPTNVLSFPFEAPEGIELDLLGDLVICADVVAEEAQHQNKLIQNHWAHMVIHGTLHLLGYDHIEDNDAEQMEKLEITILANLSIDDPYQDH